MKKIFYQFLKWTARQYVRRHTPYVIGITGSMGKTTCRMILAQVLQQQFPSLCISTSPKNFNTEIGMVLSVLEIEQRNTNPLFVIWTAIQAVFKALFATKKYDVLILEYGIDHPGDMDYLLSITKPHMSIFTGIDKVHAVYFEDMDALLAEKMKLLLGTKELIFTPEQAGYTRQTLEQVNIDHLTYALRDDEHADIYFTHHRLEKDKNTVIARFNLMQERESVGEVVTNLLGQEEAGYISLAIEVGMVLSHRISLPSPPPLLNIHPSSSGEEEDHQGDYHFSFQQQAGRYTLFEGKFGSVLVDSSYNAGPKSMQVVIDNTVALRRAVYPDFDLIYCLGDMRELGSFGEEEHRKLASLVAQSADEIYLVGKWMISIFYDELEKLGYNIQHIHTFKESLSLGSQLLSDIEQREHCSVILFKGSQNTIFLEEAVKTLLKHDEDKEKLCRQGRWREKKKVSN